MADSDLCKALAVNYRGRERREESDGARYCSLGGEFCPSRSAKKSATRGKMGRKRYRRTAPGDRPPPFRLDAVLMLPLQQIVICR